MTTSLVISFINRSFFLFFLKNSVYLQYFNTGEIIYIN